MSNEYPARLHGVQRCRKVSLENAWLELKANFYRNHIQFRYTNAYIENYAGKARHRKWESPTDSDFTKAMNQFLQNHTQGLYDYKSGSPDSQGIDIDYDVYFEREDELEAFLNNFLVLYKLSN